MNAVFENFAVIGAGAWGTALAVTARRAGRGVSLWARNPELARRITETRENADYLPGVTLDAGIRITADAAEALGGADAVLIAAPAQHMRGVISAMAPFWPETLPAVICAKGIETKTGKLVHQVLSEVLAGRPVAVLSGPTFAAEAARGLPAAAVVACAGAEHAAGLARALSGPAFRVYPSTDVAGVEVCGAMKNVLAIACGVVGGRKLGENARAALITRGLAEIARLCEHMGGARETVMGLAGIGDVNLTCSAMQSRNYSLGAALGEGQALEDILKGRRAVTEGVATAGAAAALAEKLGVDMPITKAVNAVLHQGAPIDDVVTSLLSRPLRPDER
ncbi:MAG: NAD(P)H-dependent glycerol-3-phosphate dehydrogenase [Rhodospirillales bacterium]